jgi:hypothetical protein
MDLVGIYIAEETDFELSDATGTPCFVHKKRRSGVLCECFDRVQKKRTTANCGVCYNTNWVGGYHDPIDCYIDFAPNPKNIQITQWGETQTNETRLKMSNFPSVGPGDLIRELRTNRLWRATNVGVTEKRRVQLIQFPAVVELKPSDVEYKMPVNETLMLQLIQEFEQLKRRREF